MCKKNRFYYQLAICYARKGILLSNLNQKNSGIFFQKAFEILDIIEEDNMQVEIKKEINYYTLDQSKK